MQVAQVQELSCIFCQIYCRLLEYAERAARYDPKMTLPVPAYLARV
jgi:hypothetical protein